MGYYKKIIGGIILIILGIPAIGISSWLYDQASIVLSQCNSIGGLPRFLSPEDCSNASIASSVSLVGLLIGGIMILVGLILLIVGIVKGKKPKVIGSTKIENEKVINLPHQELSDSKVSQNEKIYCRYCGKVRPLEGEYCPRCGKSSISQSAEEIIECKSCHSLVSEDSRYCSNCGIGLLK